MSNSILTVYFVLFLLATIGSCAPGWCNPSKNGCMAPMGSVIKCTRGYCDAAADGWGCCAQKGGRITGSPDYPFMCATKLPFSSYGANSTLTSALQFDAGGLMTGVSDPNPCVPTWSSESVYNTVCEFPIKATPAECDPFGGLTGGVLNCGYVGQCNPGKTGCMEPHPASDPMLCESGATCDAATDGWNCCASKRGRVTGSPNYPHMCATKLPFTSYGASTEQTSTLTFDGEGLMIGVSSDNPCIGNSAAYNTVCEFPVKATPSECDSFGGLINGVLACAFKNTLERTCGEVRTMYKTVGCCGNPSKIISVE